MLDLEGVLAGYGEAIVLRGVDLHVEKGKITCVIGPNGAGKSTLLRTVSGLLTPIGGTVEYDGRTISGLSPRRVLELGIVQLPQEPSLFPQMTIWENVLMGAHILKDKRLVRRRAAAVSELYPIVAERPDELAGSLSGGEQRRVELARTLMLDPTLVLLDEPSIGLDPKARKAVFEAITAMNQTGTTVLLVEQNAKSGLMIAHNGVVMEAGRVRLTRTAKNLLDDPEVGRLFLGAAAREQGIARTGSETRNDDRHRIHWAGRDGKPDRP